MSDFPPAGMTQGEDSSKLAPTFKDNTVKTQIEGGYVFTRPRTTRKPRRVFKTGFTEITNDDKILLENFFEMKQCSAPFTWTDWTTGQEYVVRFLEPIKFDYVGVGETKLWNVPQITLEQV